MYEIYNADYQETKEGDFETIEDAAGWALSYLPTDDFVYLIGTADGVEAVVFQGQVFFPKRTGVLGERE